MQLTTILNRVEKYKSFVYPQTNFSEDGKSIEVTLRPRKGNRPVCSGCGRQGAIYDHQRAPRRFEFVPLWQIAVVFVYTMRRVECRWCGVRIERVPWCEGKHRLTRTYRWFLAHWARRLSWLEVARVFGTSWQTVYRSVRYAVMWGIAHEDWSGVESIGIDEIAYQKGHKYLTLVYQIDEGRKRLLDVTQERTQNALEGFFNLLGEEGAKSLRLVVSDMWRPYLDVVAERACGAVHVLDRFHIMKMLGEAIDQVRRDESRRLKADGYEPILKRSRWCFLKRPENLTDKQTVTLKELLDYNLKTVRAYLCREEFQRFWEYTSAGWAGKFLDEWTGRVMRSPSGAAEEGGPQSAVSLGTAAELVPGQRAALSRRGRGLQQQSESDNEKIVRLPHGGRSASRPVSQPCITPGARISPLILVTRRKTRHRPPRVRGPMARASACDHCSGRLLRE